MTAEASFTHIYTRALQGEPTHVVDVAGEPLHPLPVGTWTRSADPSDLALLALCRGATIDVGCGPGRLTLALAELGHPCLGVDLVAESVRLACQRGAYAVTGDVFDRVPGEGSWETALLADGNVGIGGEPVRLLRRVAALLRPGGRVVVELGAPGGPSGSGWAALEGPAGRSRPFRWAWVTTDGMDAVAAEAGLGVESVHELPGRWAAVLTAGPA